MAQAIFFNGTDGYLIANANSGSFGTADFTVEAFVKLKDVSGTQCIFNNYNTYNANSLALFAPHTSATDKYSVAIGSTGFPNITSASRPSVKSFDHVAVTRQGNTITLYVNGNREGTACTFTGNLTHSSGNTWIGSDGSVLTRYFEGWMNGLRIIKNECLYTANFTPPTILTLTTNTTLLTCNVLSLNTSTNLCIDQSNVGYSITTVGEVGEANSGLFIQYANTGNDNITINTAPEYLFSNVVYYNVLNNNLNVVQYYSGFGTISGTLKKKVTVQRLPIQTDLFLYSQKEKILIDKTTSNSSGNFSFTNLNINEKFYIVAFDPALQRNAVIEDNITPV